LGSALPGLWPIFEGVGDKNDNLQRKFKLPLFLLAFHRSMLHGGYAWRVDANKKPGCRAYLWGYAVRAFIFL